MRRAKSSARLVPAVVAWVKEKNGAKQAEIAQHFGWSLHMTWEACSYAQEAGLLEMIRTSPSCNVLFIPEHAQKTREKLRHIRAELVRISAKKRWLRGSERVLDELPDEPTIQRTIKAGSVPPAYTEAPCSVFALGAM